MAGLDATGNELSQPKFEFASILIGQLDIPSNFISHLSRLYLKYYSNRFLLGALDMPLSFNIDM